MQSISGQVPRQVGLESRTESLQKREYRNDLDINMMEFVCSFLTYLL